MANFGAGKFHTRWSASIKFHTRWSCIPWPKSLAKKLGMSGLFLGAWIAVCHQSPKDLLITADFLLLGISHSDLPFLLYKGLHIPTCSSCALLL